VLAYPGLSATTPSRVESDPSATAIHPYAASRPTRSRSAAGRGTDVTEPEFVEQALSQTTIRPRRIAYLVQAGSSPQVRKAIGYACTEWAGISHPIVPVRRRRAIDPGIWQQLDVLRPEAFIDYVGVSDNLRLKLAQRYVSEYRREADLEWDEPGLHVLAVMSPGALRARTMFLPRRAGGLSAAAALGVLPEDPEHLERFSELQAAYSDAAAPIDVFDAQVDLPSPAWLARQQFRIFSGSLFAAPVIIFTDRQPPVHRVVRFWNTRALGAGSPDVHVLWMPADDLLAPGIARRIEDLCRRKIKTEPDVVLIGRDEARLHEVALGLGLALRSEQQYSIQFLNRNAPPNATLTYWVNKHPMGFVLEERRDGFRVNAPQTITRPVATLHITSPIAFDRRYVGKLRLEIEGVPSLDWPKRHAVARLFKDNATWSQNGLGLVLGPSDRFDITLRVPTPPAVLTEAIREAGWSWALSEKGKYAAALASSLPDGTLGSLKSRRALAVTRALGSLSSKKAEQALRRVIPQDALDDDSLRGIVFSVLPALVPQWLSAEQIRDAVRAAGLQISKAVAVATLNDLARDRLVMRGVRFDCRNCGLASYLPFGSLSDHIRCAGCGVSSALLVGVEEPRLLYSLNSLLDRALDQDCVGHLLALEWMTRTLKTVFGVPGANVLPVNGGHGREIDVLAVSRTSVVVAEVKNSLTGFDDETVRSTSDLARGLGADHLVLAALADWSDSERTRIHDLATGIREVTVIGLAEIAAQ